MFLPTQVLEGMYVHMRVDNDRLGPRVTDEAGFKAVCAEAEALEWTPELAAKVLCVVNEAQEGGLFGWLAEYDTPIFVADGEVSNQLSQVVEARFTLPKAVTAE